MSSTPAPFLTNSLNKTETTPDMKVLMESNATLTPVVYNIPIYKKAIEQPHIRHMKGGMPTSNIILNTLQPISSLK